jgi:hypothetical protein
MIDFRTGDRVRIKCEERTIDGEIVFASGNGKSLMLGFDALLAGHVGMMPVLREDDGRYHSIMSGVEVEIKPEE